MGAQEPSRAIQPDAYADHAAWMSYAISQGMPPREAQRRTRDQLRACFRPSNGMIPSEPDLERHDRDPDAIAARKAARDQPWEWV